jgi:hypothetical protein
MENLYIFNSKIMQTIKYQTIKQYCLNNLNYLTNEMKEIIELMKDDENLIILKKILTNDIIVNFQIMIGFLIF